MKRLLQAMVLMAVLGPMMASTVTAAGLEGIGLVTGYITEPVSQTGGAHVMVTLPFGTMPGSGWIPEAVTSRLFYGVGGRFATSGPGPQPPDGLLLVGLGVRLHAYLGLVGGLSRHESSGGIVSNTTFLGMSVDSRMLGALVNPDLLGKITGP